MSIDWRTSYHDLCKEIEVLDLRADDLEKEARVCLRTVWTGEPPSDHSNYVHMPLDKALRNYEEVMERLCRVQEILRNKRIVKAQIESRLNEFEGLEHKVAKMRDIDGLQLDEIADKLGYSYTWIRKISFRVPRMKEQRRNNNVG